MQLTQFRRGKAVVAFVSALLLGHAAQGATAAELYTIHSAASAAQRDTDPGANGAVGDELRARSEGSLLKAAAATRRDSDPNLNGSLSESPPPRITMAGSSPFAEAWVHYERCHWQAAFDAFTAAADAGVPEAARMALAMARHGSLLYRQTFEISAERRGSWQRLERRAPISPANVQSASRSAQ